MRENVEIEMKYGRNERGNGDTREKEFLTGISSLAHELMIERESVQRRRSQFVVWQALPQTGGVAGRGSGEPQGPGAVPVRAWDTTGAR